MSELSGHEPTILAECAWCGLEAELDQISQHARTVHRVPIAEIRQAIVEAAQQEATHRENCPNCRAMGIELDPKLQALLDAEPHQIPYTPGGYL